MFTRMLILLVILVPFFSITGCRSNSNTCVAGTSAACVCSDGRVGAQVCQTNASFGVCSCTSVTTDPGGCVPGMSTACACSDGSLGAQTCKADRSFASCQCRGADAATGCVEGRAVACSCADGRMGAQVCQPAQTFGPCTCDGTGATDAGDGSVADGGVADGATGDGSVLSGVTVLDFPNPVDNLVAVHVNHGLFWPAAVDLGINFFWDAYVAPRTDGYLVSDGYGGAHAMLWGPEFGDDNQMIFKGNIWNGVTNVMYAASEGPAPGEWGYHALGLVKDPNSANVFLYTYWNGITVGITQFGDLTRHALNPAGGNGVLYVMGSTHQNLGGRLAALRAWDRASPFTVATTAAAAFVPERAFSSQLGDATPADFLVDYTRPAIAIQDLSPIGYAGGASGPPQRHPGRIINSALAGSDTLFSPTHPSMGPLATWVVDPTCPYGVAGQLPPNTKENIPTPIPAPPGALVFDSFGRRAQNFLWQQVPTLGRTEGGTLGPLDWKSGIVGTIPTVPAPWGIINGRAVYLENQAGIAWVDVGTADQDVRIKKFIGPNPTGIAFRVQDRQNFWFAVVPTKVDPIIPAAVHVGYFQNGTSHEVGSYLPADMQWLTLRVQAIGSTVTIYRDNIPLGSLTNAVQLQTATGAGMAGSINTVWASSFWRGANFTVCGAAGC